MPTQELTLALPEIVFRHLQARAHQTQRTIEAEAVEALASAVTTSDALPPNLETTRMSLDLLNDAELWQAAQIRQPQATSDRLAELNDKRQCEGLTAAEAQEAGLLLTQYDRAMLIRAQASQLLKQRGFDINSLLATL
jgi:plasmid stability protein